MIVYVETNFVLELVFAQEQHATCEHLLALSESGVVNLVVQAYCLAEPHEKLSRQAQNRRTLQQDLRRELRQLTRTASYAERIGTIEAIEGLLVHSKDFDNPDIVDELAKYNCRMIPRFNDGLRFVETR